MLLAGCKQPDGDAATSSAPPAFVSQSGIEMISLPGGTFTMGTSEGNPDEGPPHKVTVSGFLIDKFVSNP